MATSAVASRVPSNRGAISFRLISPPALSRIRPLSPAKSMLPAVADTSPATPNSLTRACVVTTRTEASMPTISV